MTLYLTHMDKRLNSTKHGSPYEDYEKIENVRLKEPCNRKNPTFLVHIAPTGLEKVFPYYNYIYAEYWGYYYIDDVVFVTNDLCELVCHRDVLASGLPYIKEGSAFLSYCSDEAFIDKNLIDERLGPDVNVGTTVNSPYLDFIDLWFVDDPSEGTVLLTVMGLNEGTATYAVPISNFVDICIKVSQADISTQDLLASTFFGSEWKSCVLSAVYVPMNPQAFDTIWANWTTKIMWGTVEVDAGKSIPYTGTPYSWGMGTVSHKLSYPKDLTGDLVQFKGEKYNNISFEYPGGSINLSNDLFINNDDLTMKISLSILDGTLTFKFYAGDAQIGQCSCTVGWDVMKRLSSIPSTNEMWANVLNRGFKMLPSIAAGVSAGGFVSAPIESWRIRGERDIGAEIADTANNIATSQSFSTGIIGAFSGAACGASPRYNTSSAGIEGYFFKDGDTWKSKESFRLKTTLNLPAIIDDSGDAFKAWHEKYGWPCNKMVALSSVAKNSYIQAVGASLGNVKNPDSHVPLYPSEIAELNTFINTGIYLEDFDHD